MHLIGINGFKRSGKGAVADIVDSLADGDHVVKQVGFADKLKVLAARALGFTDLDDKACIQVMDQWKETGWLEGGEVGGLDPVVAITGRQYLQNIGNEARGIFGDTFWIDMVLPNPILASGWSTTGEGLLEAQYPGVDCLCITDLRYPNEAQRVLDLGGVVWEVLRPGLESDGHASEIPLDRSLVTWQIHNDGSLGDLEGRVEEALNSL